MLIISRVCTLRCNRRRTLVGLVGALWLGAACLVAPAAQAAKPLVKIAVFDFELEDASPAAALAGTSTSSADAMDKVSAEARRVLLQSGRYSLIDVKQKLPRQCDGCQNGIALALGAEQAMIGVVRRVTQTDYYVVIQISNCRSGKVVDQQAANFAGGDDGWASGVRMLITHGILGDQK